MHRLRAGAGAAVAVPALLALVALLAGCSSPGTTPPSGGGNPTPTPVPEPTASAPALPTDGPAGTIAPGQVDSEWGPIWADLPEGFPVHPGAQEAEADAVVSAAYTVPAGGTVNARTVASWYGQELSNVGYGGGLDGPLEDGSYAAWSSNGYGCDIRAAVVPRGSAELYVTIFYGALCPFEWGG